MGAADDAPRIRPARGPAQLGSGSLTGSESPSARLQRDIIQRSLWHIGWLNTSAFAGSLGRGGGWFRSSGRVWVVRLHQPARDAGWRPGKGPGKAGSAFHVKHALALGSRGLLKLPEGRSCRGDSLGGWPEDRRTPGEPRPRHPKAPEPCVSRETPPCPRIPRARRAGGRADLPGGRVPGQQPSLRREAALWGPSGPVGGSMPGGSASRRRPTGAAGEVAGETLGWPQRGAEDAWTSPYAA